MKNSKMSLAVALLMLFILACTCGNRGKNSNANRVDINVDTPSNGNGNSSNSNRRTNSNDNRTTSTAATGITECDEYMAAMDEYLNCPNVPESSREQYRKQREETATKIRDAAKTETGKAIMASVCKQMTSAIKDEIAKCK